jgi:hypothetical protein
MPLPSFLNTLVEWIDHFFTRLTAKLGWLRPLQLDAYYSYGTEGKFYIKGRLLADRGIAPPPPPTRAGATSAAWCAASTAAKWPTPTS